ncbi:MAG: hypothetical protein QOE34_2423 [Verrucomicrobiota bacterium]|jgi:type II secretory pathway pseudopilin PulG
MLPNFARDARENPVAFTTLRLLVLIFLVAILAFLAVPTLKDALNKREMDRTMNHAREIYLAGFHMATDGAAKSDAGSAWPGDYDTMGLADYCTKLVQNGYLKVADLQRILSAPDAICKVTGAGAVVLTGKSALKVYKVKRTDPSNTIFSASSNYIYDTPLNPNAAPFHDNGFIVIRKSGDAGVYRKNQATPAGFENDRAKFQSALGIGQLPGAAEGVVAPGDGATVLAGPQQE